MKSLIMSVKALNSPCVPALKGNHTSTAATLRIPSPCLCMCVWQLVSSGLVINQSAPLFAATRPCMCRDEEAGSESGGMSASPSASPYDANCNRTGTAWAVCERHCYSSAYCLRPFWQSPCEWEPVKPGGSPSLEPFMSIVMRRRGYCRAIGDFQQNLGRSHNDKDKFCLSLFGPSIRRRGSVLQLQMLLRTSGRLLNWSCRSIIWALCLAQNTTAQWRTHTGCWCWKWHLYNHLWSSRLGFGAATRVKEVGQRHTYKRRQKETEVKTEKKDKIVYYISYTQNLFGWMLSEHAVTQKIWNYAKFTVPVFSKMFLCQRTS